MKKIICMLLVLALSMSLSACGSEGGVFSNTVELTIPAEFLEMIDEDFDYTLTEENKENGFTDIKKNEDGSATYTIKKSDYKKLKKELQATTKESLDELVTEGSFPSLERIEYNDDFSEITIFVDKDSYENSFDSLAVTTCGLCSLMYQIFDIDAENVCEVTVKDSSTDKVIDTQIFPEK